MGEERTCLDIYFLNLLNISLDVFFCAVTVTFFLGYFNLQFSSKDPFGSKVLL